MKFNELKNINNLTSNTLSIGQTLVLPTKTATPTPSTPSSMSMAPMSSPLPPSVADCA